MKQLLHIRPPAAFALLLSAGLLTIFGSATPSLHAETRQFLSTEDQKAGKNGLLLRSGEAVGTQEDGRSRWLVFFEEPGLLRFSGASGVPGPRWALKSEGERPRLDIRAPQSLQALAFVRQQQAGRVAEVGQALGRTVQPTHSFQVLRNGIALDMTLAEAEKVRALPGVALVASDRLYKTQGDAGPQWVGAPDVWSGASTGGLGANQGEGVVIGVIDTGVNSDHGSFSDLSEDGYNFSNPLGGNLGVCATPGSFTCNDKLIGAWDFADASGCEADGPEDDEGHGSHVASIALGNAKAYPPVSGTAPHSNLVVYDTCYYRSAFTTCQPPSGQPAGGVCPYSATAAAVDQAVLDGVDILNYSIQGGGDPWHPLDINSVFLDAIAAGILPVATAGNGGPSPGTVTHLGPWVLTVAATTHHRVRHEAELAASGGGSVPPADLLGASFNPTEYGPAAIVYAGDYASDLPSGDATAAERCLEPFPPGTFAGEIVVCEFFGSPSGPFGQVLKAQNVANGGAGGLIVLANSFAPAGFEIPTAYHHPIPAIQLDKDPSVDLMSWLGSGSGHQGTLGEGSAILDSNVADRIWNTSSRGPAYGLEVIKPDLGAPGYQVFAADGEYFTPGFLQDEYNWRSGTSMAAPIVSGAAAMVKSLHPTWSPSEIKSALMLTARTDVSNAAGSGPADSFDVGSGRLDLTRAARVGLVLDESYANYLAADPDNGGDPASLNLPSMASLICDGNCVWARTVTGAAAGAVGWTVSVDSPAQTELEVTPASFSLSLGQDLELAIEARVLVSEPEQWRLATVTLTPDDGSPTLTMPVAFFSHGLYGDLLHDGFEPGTTSVRWSTQVPTP